MTVPPGIARLACRAARCRRPLLAILLATLILVGNPFRADGQLLRLEEPTNVGDICLSSVGYDPVNRLFLVVTHGCPHPSRGVSGGFVDTSGTVVWGASLRDLPAYGGRLAYSPDISNGAGGLGGFLVADPIKLRIAAYPAGWRSAASLSSTLNAGVLSEMDVAYSPTSREFLFVFAGYTGAYPVPDCRGCRQILVVRVGLDAQPVTPKVDVVCSLYCDNPKVEWNPVSNEFGITYELGSPATISARLVGFTRVSMTGAVVSKGVVLSRPNAIAHDPVLAVNEATGHYVVVWEETAPLSHTVVGAEIDTQGGVVASGVISDKFWEEYAPVDLAYNPVSGTFLLTGPIRTSPTRAGALELNGRGAPHSTLAYVMPYTTLLENAPSVSSASDTSAWAVAFSRAPWLHESSMIQMVGTSTTGGGSDWPLGVPCTTPDPFEALGGGQCVNGGWRMIDTLPLSPSAPVVGPGGCVTRDPFVALGGGTCVNSAWFPPGMTIPAPPAPPTTGGCTTPDPFVALGGGTCVNSGWFPPGMTIPLPPVLPTTGGCTTPDPFIALGGGTCVNGGWLPPGMPVR